MPKVDSNKQADYYRHLSQAEQSVLQVLSVVYEPVTQTLLQEILQQLGWKIGGIINRSWQEKMLRRNLVMLEQGKLICHPGLANTLCFETVKNGSFDAILAAGLSKFPDRSYRGHDDFQGNAWRFSRQLRNAVFKHDEMEMLRLLDIEDPYAEPDADRSRKLLDVCRPLITDWFHTLPQSFKYQMLKPFMDNRNLMLGATDEGYKLMRDCHSQNGMTHPAFRASLAEQELYRLNWAAVDELLADDPGYESQSILAAKQFLQGDNDLALQSFARSIKIKKKELKKRITHIQGIAGVFYCLALVRSGTPESVQLLRQQVSASRRDHVHEPFYHTYLLLLEFQDIWDGRTGHASDLEISPQAYLSYHPPLFLHILALTHYWLDRPVPDKLLARLKTLAGDARDSGCTWQASELDQLVAACAGEDVDTTTGLVGMVVKIQSWERALNALSKLTVPTTKNAISAAPDEARMVWILIRGYYNDIEMLPKEQKKRKNGSWTKGRAIALKRLAEEPELFNSMTAEDAAICSAIKRQYHRYGQASYTLNHSSALSAAAGHPLVFWQDQPNNPVDIVSCDPELVVKQEQDQVSISIFPNTDIEEIQFHENDNQPERVVIEGPGRIDIYNFTEAHTQISRILGEEGLKVPLSAKEKVLESIATISPLLTIHSDLQGIEQSTVQRIDADSRLYVNLLPIGDELKLNMVVQPFGEGPRFLPGQGGNTVFAEVNGKRLQADRSLDIEKERLDQVLDLCPGLVHQASGQWLFPDLEQALEGLLRLQQLEEALVFTWPAGKKITLHREVGVSTVTLSIRSKTNWFEIDGEIQTAESEVLDIQKLLTLIGESPGRFIRLGDNEFIALTSELRKRLEQLQSISSKGRIHPLAAFHLDEIADGMVLTADNEWEKFQHRLNDARDLQPVMPTTFEGQLRDYQLQGYAWLCRLAAWGAGACLADDMGLGKTIQSLALLLNRAPDGPALVIAPTSVCMNWMDEAQRFTPTLNPRLFGGGDRSRMIDDLKPFDLVVCSYGLLTTESDLLTNTHWHTIIADEAQAFKNANTRRSKAMMKLEGDFKVITTGTPIENHVGELWNLFNFINRGLLGSHDEFNRNYASAVESGDPQARQRLRNLITPFVLRRLKREVLTELPPRTDITLTVELSKAEVALYEALRREAISEVYAVDSDNQRRMIVLAQITRLRRVVCNPALVIPDAGIPSAKLTMFGELVDELLENRHKALVFSQFVGHLTLIREYLDERGVVYQYLDGSTRPVDRRRAVTAFQAGEGQLFLISLRAGGMGLNLTAADYVIHMDPWWNPAVEDQASDRAHRIGQQRPVTVYRLVADNTIEQKIVELHRHKRDLADSLLEGTDIGARMSFDEMLSLIGEV